MKANIHKTTLVLLLTLLLVGRVGHSQESDFQFVGTKTQVTFGFRLVNNLILVPVVLNDSLPMQFILDTGLRSTLLIVESDSIQNSANCRPVKIAGLGNAGEVTACALSDVRLCLPGIVGNRLNIIALNNEFLDLESHLGYPVQGILGYDFFSSFIVKIDYVNAKITVYKPEVFRQPAKYEKLPLKIENGRPFVKAAVCQLPGIRTDGSFLIDTGASHSLLLQPDEQQGIHLPTKTIPTVIGWGLSGQIDGLLGRIHRLELGSFSFNNALVSFADFIQSPSPALPDRIGSIGGEILSRFTIILDYQNETIFLRKNFQYKRLFDHNMSGLDVVVDKRSAHTFRVVNLMDHSPASEAGIMVGDQIVALNRKGSGQLSLEEIQGIFRSGSYEPIQLVILRNNQFYSFSIILRKLI